jgi:outer membrane protein OmpA-like peptidoglycan-associated protein
MRRFVPKTALLAALLAAQVAPLWAQGQQISGQQPSAQQMIEALRGAPRSMRNLGVEAVPAPAAPGGIDPSNIPMPPLRLPGGAPVPSSMAAPALASAAAVAVPVQAPAVAQATPSAGAIDLALQFEFDSDRLSARDRATVQELALAMRSPELQGRRFLIQGHTDNQGNPAYNLRLSRLRAQAVHAMLVAQNVAPERLRAEGKGAEQPADPAHPDAPQNRRVRIISQVQ